MNLLSRLHLPWTIRSGLVIGLLFLVPALSSLGPLAGPLSPQTALADLKCGDAPMPFGPEGLVVTWVGPAPADARVTITDGEIFRLAAEQTGAGIPEDYPEKYTKDLQYVEVFNASMAWDLQEVTRWQERHGIKMEDGPSAVFQKYLDTDHVILETLVQHPVVENPELFVACSIVLQRGVIVYEDGWETLSLRSYFHSAADSDNFVNFAPSGGIEMVFPSDAIWFPLELSQFIVEPASYVVLDILTTSPLDAGQLPDSFRLEKSGRVDYNGTTYEVSRVSATLKAGQETPDFQLPVS